MLDPAVSAGSARARRGARRRAAAAARHGIGAHTGDVEAAGESRSWRAPMAFDAPGPGARRRRAIPRRARAPGPHLEVVLDALGVEQAACSATRSAARSRSGSRGARGGVRSAWCSPPRRRAGAVVPGSLRTLARMSTPLRYYWRSYYESIARDLMGGRFAPRRRRSSAGSARAASTEAADPLGYAWQLAALSSDFGSLPWLHRVCAADARGDRRRRPGDAARQRAAARPQAARRAPAGRARRGAPAAARPRQPRAAGDPRLRLRRRPAATRSRSPGRCSTPSCAPAPSPTRWR